MTKLTHVALANGTSLLVPIISCLTTKPSGVMSAAAVKSREAFQPQRVATTDAGAGRNSNTHTLHLTLQLEQARCPVLQLAPRTFAIGRARSKQRRTPRALQT